MKLAHLESLAVVCPVCREGSLAPSRPIWSEAGELEEGILGCGRKSCEREYPVVDGIPILVADARRVVGEQTLSILGRSDLSETMLAALGEASGPSSPLDAARQNLSSYVSGHWGDHDPGERSGGERPGSIVGVLGRALEGLRSAKVEVAGPVLDLGCSVGRTTSELALRKVGGGTVVGLDLSFAMLRVARRALREGRVTYARRRSGLVYEERIFSVPRAGGDVALFCADALALPFRPGTFGLATSFNLVDCLVSPLDHLRGLDSVLRARGALALATPFDWAPTATPVEAWLGGHSPRGPAGGRPEAVLAALLGGDHPVAVAGLSLIEHVRGLDWFVRLHDRAVMRYDVDLFLARKQDWKPGPA